MDSCLSELSLICPAVPSSMEGLLLVALDTASHLALQRKHRMLSRLESEHTEPIPLTSLCYATTLNTEVINQGFLTVLNL